MKKHPEMAALALYAILLCTVTVFHEPWFDEAQAWQIAKCASIREILFQIPHYEGHPPLWHLILAVLAKSGVSYEWGVKSVSIFFSLISAALILFRAPFSRNVRIALPFTYFLFYQYAVISRPYCIMTLAFVLMAIAFEKRDEKPLRFVLALALLCLTSAYGLVIAGGIALAWLLEMRGARTWRCFAGELLSDKRAYALLFLFLFAVAELVMIFPAPDTYAVSAPQEKNSLLLRLLYMLIVMPAEVSVFSGMESRSTLSAIDFQAGILVPGVFLGILIWALLIMNASGKNNRRYLILPYVLFAVFGSVVYFSRHHVGIVLLFLLFWCWITEKEPKRGSGWRLLDAKLSGLRVIAPVCVSLFLVISIVWSLGASVLDIQYPYGVGREAASFIKEHHLDGARIMTGWRGADETDEKVISPADTNFTTEATDILAYFDRNIIFNHNEGNDSLAYILHQTASEADNRRHMEEWKRQGIPEVLVGGADLESVYGKEVSIEDYMPVCELHFSNIWKCSRKDIWTYLYVKTDLLDDYDMQEVSFVPYFELETEK